KTAVGQWTQAGGFCLWGMQNGQCIATLRPCGARSYQAVLTHSAAQFTLHMPSSSAPRAAAAESPKDEFADREAVERRVLIQAVNTWTHLSPRRISCRHRDDLTSALAKSRAACCLRRVARQDDDIKV